MFNVVLCREDVSMAGMKNIPPVQSHQAARKAKVRCNVTLNVIERHNLSENNCRRFGEASHQAVETLEVAARIKFKKVFLSYRTFNKKNQTNLQR